MSVHLFAGDCLDFLRRLPDQSIGAAVTDPPYNVKKAYGPLVNDDRPPDEYLAWVALWMAELRRVCRQQWIVTPVKWLRPYWNLLPDAHLVTVPMRAGFAIRNGWTIKQSFLLVGGKVPGNPWDLWEGIRQRGEGYFFREQTFDHPGYTPAALVRRAIETARVESILDPFLGSGTTGVEAVRAGLDFYGAELDPTWFALAQKRIDQTEPSQEAA